MARKMNLREQIEQKTPKERRQFKADVNYLLANELAHQRRKDVAEARTKEELGITETET